MTQQYLNFIPCKELGLLPNNGSVNKLQEALGCGSRLAVQELLFSLGQHSVKASTTAFGLKTVHCDDAVRNFAPRVLEVTRKRTGFM
jgi:hypothetical protein